MTSQEFKDHIAKKHSGGYKNSAQLTNAIIGYLNNTGWFVWRSNTVGIFDIKIFAQKLKALQSVTSSGALTAAKASYRKTHDLKGAPDILGYHKQTGLFIGVEVKFGKDTMSDDQNSFKYYADKSKAVYIVAKSLADVIDRLNNNLK